MTPKSSKWLSGAWCPCEWLPRLLVAALFAYTGVTKILDPQGFIEGVRNYPMIPTVLSNLVAFVVPWLEVITAALLFFGLWRREARLLLVGMLIVFTAAKGYVVALGIEKPCGCTPVGSPIHFLFEGWTGVATNIGCLLLLAIEGLLEWRRRRPSRAAVPEASAPVPT